MKRAPLLHLAALLGLSLALAPARDALAAPPDKPGAPGAKPPSSKPPTKAAAAEAPKEPTREERLEQAKQLLTDAEKKLAAGDHAGALAGFRASNEIARSHQAIFRIAICLEKVGSRVEAEDALHRFLGLPPPESMAEERRIAEEHLAALAAGTLKVSSDPVSITVEVDGGPGVRTPVEVRLPPGKHVVRASAPDYEPASREIEIHKGGALELAIALRPLPPAAPAISPTAPPPAPPPSPGPTGETTRVVLGSVGIGLAAVGVAVGTAFGVRALQAQSDFNRAPSQDLADKQQTSAVIADGSFGGAIVCAVAGTVFLVQRHVEEPPAAPAARLTVVPLLAPSFQGVAARFRF